MTKTVNGVPYVEDIVPKSKWNIKCPFLMVAKKVTLHNTDNEMDAEKEARYHHSNNNETSFHLVFDEKEARQLLPFNRNGWHSGDGLNGYGNRNTIAAEIARNYDRTRRTTNLLEPLQGYYTRAEQNAIKVLAQVMIDEGIMANNDNIKTHNDWNGKWCPSKILNEGRLQQVKNGIIAEYNRLKGIETKPVKPASPKKEDGHLSLSQVVDKTIAGGYGSYPQREKNINNKTNFTYKRVQDAVNEKIKAAAKPKPQPKPVAPKPTPQPVTGKQTLHLPASAKTWRVYKPNGPYTKGNEIHLLTPSAYGGLNYEIKGNPAKDVYLIDTDVKGRVAIYAAPSTGAKITDSKAPVTKPTPKAKRLYLPASAKLWKIYHPKGPYTSGSEIHNLTPSAYGGLDYEIKGSPAPHVYLIDTGVKGRVAIYAHPSTGATIK